VRATAEAMDLLPAVLGSRRDVLDYMAGRSSRLDAGWRAPFVGEKLQAFRERVR